MGEQVDRFRREVKRAGLGRKGRRYPQELREVAVDAYRLGAVGGLTCREVAVELGISEATLERWLAAASRVVERAPELCEVVLTSQPGGAMALVTPGGYRVEGLSMAELRELLAGLR